MYRQLWMARPGLLIKRASGHSSQKDPGAARVLSLGLGLWDPWIHSLKGPVLLISLRGAPCPSSHTCASMENNQVKRTWPHRGLGGWEKEIHTENCALCMTFYLLKKNYMSQYNCKNLLNLDDNVLIYHSLWDVLQHQISLNDLWSLPRARVS